VLVMDEAPVVLDLTTSEASRVVDRPFWVGRYDEDRRQLYDTALFTAGDEPRTVHMGVDLGGPVGTPVQAVADGVVFAAGYNAAPGDYGGTLVLEHVLDGRTVWVLYGHLSRASIAGRAPGERVAAGQVVGWLGDRHENGGWPAHVHVQVAVEQPVGADLPGVVRASEREAARRAYPDPFAVLGPVYAVREGR
jgi:murein DD-endopeptidase MepM/ murein hydrolase activator NlpD